MMWLLSENVPILTQNYKWKCPTKNSSIRAVFFNAFYKWKCPIIFIGKGGEKNDKFEQEGAGKIGSYTKGYH